MNNGFQKFDLKCIAIKHNRMKLLFFDLETTGTNPGKNGIHQISGEIVINGKTMERFDFKVQPNPKCVIEEQALSVAGVTREQILAYPLMFEVYQKFVAMLGKYVDKFNKTDKFFLVGFNNASFDNQFLRGFFLQNGDQYFGSWFWSNSIDVMVLASACLADRRHEMENFKLATVAKFLGVNVDDASLHNADYDIFLTKAIYDIVI
jgi:DNA polymerase-3 subunit epsilon